jgi:hypothetical protein
MFSLEIIKNWFGYRFIMNYSKDVKTVILFQKIKILFA